MWLWEVISNLLFDYRWYSYLYADDDGIAGKWKGPRFASINFHLRPALSNPTPGVSFSLVKSSSQNFYRLSLLP